MRVVEVFVVLLLAINVALLAIYIGQRGTADGNISFSTTNIATEHTYLKFINGTTDGNISFSVMNATKGTYLKFIKALRDELSKGTSKVENITVLKDRYSVPYSQRFILVDLSNYADGTITVAIDVVNVYVVAYRANNRSYFLSDTDPGAEKYLFRNTTNSTLPFNGSYLGLQRAANKSRGEIHLGPDNLDNAIHSLNRSERNQTVAKSLIVIIEMVSEAARFEAIVYRVAKRFNSQGGRSFKPDPTMLDLENNWSKTQSCP